MMNYLDELNKKEEPTLDETRDQQKHDGQAWVANGDFLGSLKDALQLWDAVCSPIPVPTVGEPANTNAVLQVYAGVKVAGSEVSDRKMWDDVDQWLSQRR